MKQLFVIQSTELDRIWNDVKPLIEKGLVTCDGEITIDQIRMCLVQGGMKLLVSQDHDDKVEWSSFATTVKTDGIMLKYDLLVNSNCFEDLDKQRHGYLEEE